jgi:hypothetical protein
MTDFFGGLNAAGLIGSKQEKIEKGFPSPSGLG